MAKVYIDFDSLFDTRIVILQQLSRAAARRLGTNKRYFSRLDDKFWLIDNAIKESEYQEAWENRGSFVNQELLHMNEVVIELCKERMERDSLDASGVEMGTDSLVINTWPYELTEDVREELAEELISLCRYTGVNYIHVDPAKLSATYFHADFRQIIMYDLNHWLSNQYASIAEDPLVKTRVIAPLLVKTDKPISMSVTALIAKAQDELKPYFNYNPVPSSLFCFLPE